MYMKNFKTSKIFDSDRHNLTCLMKNLVTCHKAGLNHLSANPTKWSNTFKQFVGNLPTN